MKLADYLKKIIDFEEGWHPTASPASPAYKSGWEDGQYTLAKKLLKLMKKAKKKKSQINLPQIDGSNFVFVKEDGTFGITTKDGWNYNSGYLWEDDKKEVDAFLKTLSPNFIESAENIYEYWVDGKRKTKEGYAILKNAGVIEGNYGQRI